MTAFALTGPAPKPLCPAAVAALSALWRDEIYREGMEAATRTESRLAEAGYFLPPGAKAAAIEAARAARARFDTPASAAGLEASAPPTNTGTGPAAPVPLAPAAAPRKRRRSVKAEFAAFMRDPTNVAKALAEAEAVLTPPAGGPDSLSASAAASGTPVVAAGAPLNAEPALGPAPGRCAALDNDDARSGQDLQHHAPANGAGEGAQRSTPVGNAGRPPPGPALRQEAGSSHTAERCGAYIRGEDEACARPVGHAYPCLTFAELDPPAPPLLFTPGAQPCPSTTAAPTAATPAPAASPRPSTPAGTSAATPTKPETETTRPETSAQAPDPTGATRPASGDGDDTAPTAGDREAPTASPARAVACHGCACGVPLVGEYHEEPTVIPGRVYAYPCTAKPIEPYQPIEPAAPLGNAADIDPEIRDLENELSGESDIAILSRDLGRVIVPWDANDRSIGIGGSDIWSVVHDPMKVYCEKRGIVAREVDTDLTEAGRFLEPAIAAWFAARTGYRLRGDGRLVVRHPTEPWIFASPDRFVYGPDGEDLLGGLEIKNVSTWRAEAWGGPEPDTYDIPEPYYYQIQWCMGVTGLRRWWAAPLIGGNRPRFDHVIDFDEHFFADLVSIARVFWLRHVVPGVAPDVDGSASSAAYLRCRYPRATREELPPAPPEATVLAESYLELGEMIAPLEAQRETRKHQLQEMIGQSGAPGLELEPGWSVTWRPNRKGSRIFNLRRKL